jgi:superfamily I DNA/RNA helicase
MFDLSSLNPEQRLAVETTQGPVLVLAGAGTGKTRVITYRLAHLLRKGVEPGHILAVTFTNKAAREMQERVGQLVPGLWRRGLAAGAVRPTICTFHSLGVRILREHAARLGYRQDFVIYDEAEQLSTVKKILSRIVSRDVRPEPEAVLAWLSRHRNRGLGGGIVSTEAAVALARRVQSRYEAALRACNALDFDDLILRPLQLFAEHPEVLEHYRCRFRYVMVDEYQDTNATQFQLVQALTQAHRNLCVVGDDDQSIYGWRGAEIANLLDLELHYPEVRIIKLEENYRSTQVILKAANALIGHNLRRRAKKLWCRKGPGAPIVLHHFAHEEEEARAMVQEIEFARQARRIPWSDQALLFRTNHQSRPLETALRQAGVRYRVVGGQSFFDRREVRDFLAYLKVLLNPHDDVSLLRIANVPARGLSDATMQALLAASQERHCPVYQVMQHPGGPPDLTARTRASLADFVAWIDRTRAWLTAAGGGSLRPWAEGFLDEIGYLDDLRRSEREVEAGENRVRHLLDLVASLDEWDTARSGAAALRSFLDDLTLDRESDEGAEPPGEAVTLITIHSCKGLEFPHVAIVGLEEGLLPHARSALEGALDEERRLFYVAITRARETLSLSHCAARKKHGRLMPCHPSRFLSELPPELLESGGSRKPVSVETGRQWFAGMRAALEES